MSRLIFMAMPDDATLAALVRSFERTGLREALGENGHTPHLTSATGRRGSLRRRR